jgi:pimeloyl-ACP methyl ester carboxylesterase
VPYEHGVAIANAWPAAELFTTEGLGHRAILRDPQVIQRTVEFLRGGVQP